jgi:hypothetical protein
MTRESWKDIFEAVGLVAVIASLVFVGIETRNSANEAAISTRAMEIASYQELTNNIIATNLMVVGDGELTDLLERAARDPDLLTTGERARYRIWAISRFRHADLAFFQYERGVIDAGRLRSVLSPLQAIFRTQIGMEEWEYFQPNFVESFRNHINEYAQRIPRRETVFERDND